MKDFFSKCDQIRRKLRIWLHLQKKSLMESCIFCAVCFSYLVIFSNWKQPKRSSLRNSYCKLFQQTLRKTFATEYNFCKVNDLQLANIRKLLSGTSFLLRVFQQFIKTRKIVSIEHLPVTVSMPWQLSLTKAVTL